MDNELIFRQAQSCETDRIMQIIRQAQARMHAAGSRQWQDGYPAPGHISADIGRNRGYVLCKPGVEGPLSVIAYGAVVFDGEPAYDRIEEGSWAAEGPYVAVHRLVVGERFVRRGVAAALLREAAREALVRGIRSFRIDTNFDNQTMLRLLERTGFTYCGKVVYRSGERLAYEKRI